MDARSPSPDVQIKPEVSQELFPSHVYDNKAPLWQGLYAVKQEEQLKKTPRTFFTTSTIPDSSRNELKRKIAEYKVLDDDNRERYLNDRMRPTICDASLGSALEGQRGVVAARSLKCWELLGHFAGRVMTDEEYNQGATATGAALTSVDTYSFALPGSVFLSGLRYGNITSLVNANTSYEANAREYPANVQYIKHQDSGRWLILYITCSEIPEGKPLWFDYGESYWQNKNRVIDLMEWSAPHLKRLL